MAARRQRVKGRPALDLMEEAVHLLRRAPPAALAVYLCGAVPLALSVLYFWADMSQSAFAQSHCAAAAMLVTVAFIWCKGWQTVFASLLYRQVARRAQEPWTLRRFLRVMAFQAAFQGWGLFLLPIAALIFLPFPWLFAFFQNLVVFGNGTGGDWKSILSKAARHSGLWGEQNVVALFIFKFFALFVLLNLGVGIVVVPFLLKTLLGVETVFTRSSTAFLNTTLVASAVVLAWLCIDPLVKSFYVLRCFYGEAVHSGEDLKVELRSARAREATLAA